MVGLKILLGACVVLAIMVRYASIHIRYEMVKAHEIGHAKAIQEVAIKTQ